jgi:hypothetical protein
MASEQDHGPVSYFPRNAADFSHPEPIDYRTGPFHLDLGAVDMAVEMGAAGLG